MIEFAEDWDKSEPAGAERHDDDATESHANGWEPVDLTETVAGVLNGTVSRPEPTIGRFGDGCLFYPGRVNGVHGDSNAAKTWTALVTCRQELEAGNCVVYVDLEDNPAGIVGRLLLDLDVDAGAVSERFVYVRPEGRLNQAGRDSLTRLVLERRPTLVVIDSTGEALALEGANPNADEEVARWLRLLPRAIAQLGPAVLLLDHATKAGDNELWPIGSQRKRAAITGAQYLQKIVQPFSETRNGMAILVCAKDRAGNYHPRQRVAHLFHTDGAFGLRPVVHESGDGKSFRPTGYMERISKALEVATEAQNTNTVVALVGGNRKHVIQALEVLVVEGYVAREPGGNNAKFHTSLRAFREREPLDTETGANDGRVVPVPKGGEPGNHSLSGSGNHSGTTGNHSQSDACFRCLEPLDQASLLVGDSVCTGCSGSEA